MNLRCKDGDLAVVVGDFPGCEGNIGRLVQVKGPVRTPRQYPLPCWRIKPINRRGWLYRRERLGSDQRSGYLAQRNHSSRLLATANSAHRGRAGYIRCGKDS